MEHVTVTDEGPIRIVTLNNPAKGNAISKPMGEAVQAAMREFEARDDLRCAIITAVSSASVPDAVKRTRSAQGVSSQTSSAQRTSSSWLEP